jgi:hypothetical protein
MPTKRSTGRQKYAASGPYHAIQKKDRKGGAGWNFQNCQNTQTGTILWPSVENQDAKEVINQFLMKTWSNLLHKFGVVYRENERNAY